MTTTLWNSGRIAMVTLILLTIAIGTGCSGGDQTDQANESQDVATETATLTAVQQALVQQAAMIANAIAAAPDTRTKILADNHLSADEYQAMIYKISADPVLAQAYEDARKK